jgi:hypothetical protein
LFRRPRSVGSTPMTWFLHAVTLGSGAAARFGHRDIGPFALRSFCDIDRRYRHRGGRRR